MLLVSSTYPLLVNRLYNDVLPLFALPESTNFKQYVPITAKLNNRVNQPNYRVNKPQLSGESTIVGYYDQE